MSMNNDEFIQAVVTQNPSLTHEEELILRGIALGWCIAHNKTTISEAEGRHLLQGYNKLIDTVHMVQKPGSPIIMN